MVKDLIQNGWSYHEDESERLTQELERSSIDELEDNEPVQCLQLSNHIIGEHLGDWSRARRFAERVCAVNPDYLKIEMVGIHLSIARYMDGSNMAAQQAEIDSLGATQDLASAYLIQKSLLASALAGSKRFDDAQVVLSAVNRLASSLDGPRSSDRQIAATNNNVASALLDNENLVTSLQRVHG